MWFRKPTPRTEPFAPDQQAARWEWQNLCFVLEGLQADELIRNREDKFAIAKTYAAYGCHQQRVVADIRAAIEREDYSFFIHRGIPRHVLNRELAQAMLRDWTGAVASKCLRVAEYFAGRFNEDIDVFCGIPKNVELLAAANSRDALDVIDRLMEWRLPASERAIQPVPLEIRHSDLPCKTAASPTLSETLCYGA